MGCDQHQLLLICFRTPMKVSWRGTSSTMATIQVSAMTMSISRNQSKWYHGRTCHGACSGTCFVRSICFCIWCAWINKLVAEFVDTNSLELSLYPDFWFQLKLVHSNLYCLLWQKLSINFRYKWVLWWVNVVLRCSQ